MEHLTDEELAHGLAVQASGALLLKALRAADYTPGDFLHIASLLVATVLVESDRMDLDKTIDTVRKGALHYVKLTSELKGGAA